MDGLVNFCLKACAAFESRVDQHFSSAFVWLTWVRQVCPSGGATAESCVSPKPLQPANRKVVVARHRAIVSPRSLRRSSGCRVKLGNLFVACDRVDRACCVGEHLQRLPLFEVERRVAINDNESRVCVDAGAHCYRVRGGGRA